MTAVYFRTSTYSLKETSDHVADQAQKQGWKVLSRVELPDSAGETILICRQDWVRQLLAHDHQLLGFLPCAIHVFEKDSRVLIGTGQPAVIRALAPSQAVIELTYRAEKEIKELIHSAAGVGPFRPTKVKLYSTTTCPYCKMEKAWLDEHQITSEQVFVDLNPRAAQEMMQRTGQMRVPVTEIEFDNANPEFVIGFDRLRLASILEIGE